MLFFISILVCLLFVVVADKSIRKHAPIYYIAAVLWACIVFAHSQMGLAKSLPVWFNRYCMGLFSRSVIPTALFTLVMYAAVLNKKSFLAKKLYGVRGEISIIACILELVHNIIYGKKIFPGFFAAPTSFTWYKFIATIATLILIPIMLVLMVTSFKCVRKKMKFKVWKNIQRSAYLFYGLIYVHVMCLFIPKVHKTGYTNIIIYSIVFIGYAVLRLNAYRISAAKKAERVNAAMTVR